LILRAYDIGAGDEVIVPSNTYIATWLAVSHVGRHARAGRAGCQNIQP
jgi:dTDP-4-amino-4,6-dideoxygalactose transaminase